MYAGQAHGETGHGGHGGPVSWGMAARTTLHCLTGCAIGEVLGMVIGTAFGWSNAATIVAAVVLAFVFGYALTMRGVLKAGLSVRAAFGVALAADTVSILAMEILDNATVMVIPGARPPPETSCSRHESVLLHNVERTEVAVWPDWLDRSSAPSWTCSGRRPAPCGSVSC
ncbi:DUF4396 domain-containing protein [Actinomadura opuntiae]|uniref:DUF4396 domain-containing protein n=1 Tax=Actinomadura sp. OS1-43 TaxID=604315 RepID=UPI00255B3829|nr:DUF4396 domain-containing protein [Actinomadura sp. OS1-43]MDL4815051.1 DUF4396 domain-containing protein [Actinomadura sp. OS1-43]